jgi:EAL domain-containing protein (putative c-di-GMP-specific phosphodiesterase class I)
VLEKACCESRRVHERLGIDLPVSVNLSPRQFHQAHLVDDVRRVLRDSRIDPGLLTLEITESMVMDDLAGAREVMKGLNRLGVRLAVDDFGTGHSSLRYVKQFPIQEIKVDRTFVQGVGGDMVDSAIVRAVIDLAVAMGITAVAEGVETIDQLAGLRVLQCPVAQGHFFSRALPITKFEKLLVRRMGSARSVAARISASPLVS